MFKAIVLFLLFNVFNGNVSAYSYHKKGQCSITDGACQIDYFNNVVQTAANSGIPEIGVPILDPYAYKNLEVSIMGLFKLKALEGVVKGLKSCKSKQFNIIVENKHTVVEYFCEVLQIEGKYNLQTTDALKALVGDINIHGNGLAAASIEKVKIDLEIPFVLKKLEDSELHLLLNIEGVTYTYEVLGKISANIDNLYVGSQDISTVANNIFNENWKALTKFFGKAVIDIGLQVFGENANKFLATIPIKDIIMDDLSSYASD